MNAVERIRPLIERKVNAMGFDLYDLRYVSAGRHSVLRVFIDNDTGVTIDDCERVSKDLSVMLDVEGFSDSPYTLEVSSPGIDRPLRTEKDFRRVAGRCVVVELAVPIEGKTRLCGNVLGVSEGQLQLDCNGKTVSVALSSVSFGRMEIRFS